MKSKKANIAVGKLRTHRATGQDLMNDRIKLKTRYLPILQEIDRIVLEAQRIAEARVAEEDEQIGITASYQEATDQAMKQGDIDKAREFQRKELETRTLLQMSK